MKAVTNVPLIVPGQFSLIRRTHGTYYSHNKITGQRHSLKTREKWRAIELLNALNADHSDRQHAEEMAEIYQRKAGRDVVKVTWAEAMEACAKVAGKKESTRLRHRQAFEGKDFNLLRAMTITQTRPEHLQMIIKCAKPSVIKYLRKLQNFAIEQLWATTPILSPKLMRVIKQKEKRGITDAEHRAIIAGEPNPERKLFYKMVYATGAAQTDAANLRAENFNRETGVLVYTRMKTGCVCRLRFKGAIEGLLEILPAEGYLFPNLQKKAAGDRSSEFSRRCKVAGVSGVSLHSYRYRMAERLAEAGFSIREAQAALGHRSEAIAHAYSKKAEIFCSALPDEEI